MSLYTPSILHPLHSRSSLPSILVPIDADPNSASLRQKIPLIADANSFPSETGPPSIPINSAVSLSVDGHGPDSPTLHRYAFLYSALSLVIIPGSAGLHLHLAPDNDISSSIPNDIYNPTPSDYCAYNLPLQQCIIPRLKARGLRIP